MHFIFTPLNFLTAIGNQKHYYMLAYVLFHLVIADLAYLLSKNSHTLFSGLWQAANSSCMELQCNEC